MGVENMKNILILLCLILFVVATTEVYGEEKKLLKPVIPVCRAPEMKSFTCGNSLDLGQSSANNPCLSHRLEPSSAI